MLGYGCGDPPRGTLNVPPGASLSGALDLVERIFPGYYWTAQDGVTNLLPKGNPPAVMRLRIDHFSWDTAALPTAAVANLLQSGAVRDRLAELGIAGGLQEVLGLQPAPPVVNGVPVLPKGRQWKVENATLETVLNRIVASYGSAQWVYEEKTCGGEKTYRMTVH
jgi:hypothetical protein